MPPKPGLMRDSAPGAGASGPAFFHTAHSPTLQPQPRVHNENYWIASVLFVAFLALVVLRVFDRRRLNQVLNAFLRYSSVNLLYREEYAITNRTSLLLLLNFFVVTPLFIYQVLPYFGVHSERLPGPALFGLLAGGMAAIYFVKLIMIRFLGFIFDVSDAAGEYAFNVLLFNKTLGLLLFPVTVLLAFAVQLPPVYLVWTGLGLWSLVLVYRMLRLSIIGISEASVSVMYLFLYLCTLEILPFVVIIKVFVSRI